MLFRGLLDQAAVAKINEENENFLPKIRRGEMDICCLGDEEIRCLYRLYVSTQLQVRDLQRSWGQSCNGPAGSMRFEKQLNLEKQWNELQQKLTQLATMILMGLEAEARSVECYYDPQLLRIRQGWRIVLTETSSSGLVPNYADPFNNMINDPDELPD